MPPRQDAADARSKRARDERDERFPLIVESAVDFAIVSLDPERNVTSSNRGAPPAHRRQRHRDARRVR